MKDYCGAMVAHKEICPASQELMDFYYKHFAQAKAGAAVNENSGVK